MEVESGGQSAGPTATARRLPRDVMLRAASALVMAVIAGGLLYAGALPFAVLVALVALLTIFEWSRIVHGEGIDAALAVQLAVVAGAAGLTASGFAALAVAAITAGAILGGLLRFQDRPLLSAAGVLYAGLPAVSLIWLRDDVPFGLEAVLFVLVAVVATDIAAFVLGRTIGGPKLAPAMSPNKTWSGFLGGIVTAGLAAGGIAVWLGADVFRLGLGGVALGILAQIGDLVESALKRRFGLKDSGALIPGHGGIMDRIDGLVFAAVAAGLYAFALDPQAPARALLYGG